MGLGWMAWTFETAAFFAAIGCLLVAMTVWEILVPGGGRRRGVLAVETTRGDRLFIGLLGAAWIHVGWLMGSEQALWVGSIIAVVWFLAVMRFG